MIYGMLLDDLKRGGLLGGSPGRPGSRSKLATTVTSDRALCVYRIA